MFLQDFFTVGIGWVLFGGLPFDLVSFGVLFLMGHLSLYNLPVNTEPKFSYAA